MELQNNQAIVGGLCSSETLRCELGQLMADPHDYILLSVDCDKRIEISRQAIERMWRIMTETDASVVYSDYRLHDQQGVESVIGIDYQFGSVRNDFNFGPLVMLSCEHVEKLDIDDVCGNLNFAAWYGLRLALSSLGPIVRIPEMLYDAYTPETSDEHSEEAHFAYVSARNREVQIEMEQVFTRYLRRIGAWLPPREDAVDFSGQFPVEASVVIPVRNRVNTIADAIFSALDQQADFEYNVIVVDNHSTDGTTEVIRRLSDDPRLIHIVPESVDLGIGGCWNRAIEDPRCGRFAVQLDSDDIYNSSETLSSIVRCFYEQKCAMVVGSYSLTDFNLNPLPPGVIDHREWSDENGHNNLLRVNGLGAPRAFSTEIARRYPMPDVSYGEDYAMGLRLSRDYRIGRIFDVLYLCRRWEGNSDSSLSREKANRFNMYKDRLRTWELLARMK